MDLQSIKTSRDYLHMMNDYIKSNGGIKFRDLIRFCHHKSIELGEFCELNGGKFSEASSKDKGLLGKLVEYYIFGNLPNNDSRSDLEYGDIKTTHVKKLLNGRYNAKERLTITNFGDPFKGDIIDGIVSKVSIKDTKYYDKISKGIIIVVEHQKDLKSGFEDLMDRRIMGIVQYDIDNISYSDNEQINEDFKKIKKCLLDGKPTQSGQVFLHIHKHGKGGGDNTRAFGFTNKFLTKLIANNLNLELSTGRSYSFLF